DGVEPVNHRLPQRGGNRSPIALRKDGQRSRCFQRGDPDQAAEIVARKLAVPLDVGGPAQDGEPVFSQRYVGLVAEDDIGVAVEHLCQPCRARPGRTDNKGDFRVPAILKIHRACALQAKLAVSDAKVVRCLAYGYLTEHKPKSGSEGAGYDPAARARRISSDSEVAPVLRMIEARWFSTVRRLMSRSAAIFLLGCPAITSLRISRSRGESSASRATAASCPLARYVPSSSCCSA